MMNCLPSIVNQKRKSNERISGSKKKRVTEPRPHPADCLNKKYWDDIRAGRIPEPGWIKPEQKRKSVPSMVFNQDFGPMGTFSQNTVNPFPHHSSFTSTISTSTNQLDPNVDLLNLNEKPPMLSNPSLSKKNDEINKTIGQQSKIKENVCILPIPVPVPIFIPLTTDFVLKHLGKKISIFLFQLIVICFEIYTLKSTWRLFSYICDLLMAEKLKGQKVFDNSKNQEKESSTISESKDLGDVI
uniref:Uncharacterized protein n=1 Tax=Panagrolaimus sp. JU765 TaxID=591449 RepID=A0AC34QI22_9BILA